MPRAKPGPRVYQLRISLEGIDPPIWRSVQVPAVISLLDLHDVVQAVMGWDGDHLWEFRIGKQHYPLPEIDWFPFYAVGPLDEDADEAAADAQPDDDVDDVDEDGEGRRDLLDTPLNQLITRVRSRFRYIYDFGDDWRHELQVEKILVAEPGARYSVCIAGARNSPPEDCGGVWGYYDILQALENPCDPDNRERLDWLGRGWKPETFSLQGINRRLRRYMWPVRLN